MADEKHVDKSEGFKDVRDFLDNANPQQKNYIGQEEVIKRLESTTFNNDAEHLHDALYVAAIYDTSTDAALTKAALKVPGVKDTLNIPPIDTVDASAQEAYKNPLLRVLNDLSEDISPTLETSIKEMIESCQDAKVIKEAQKLIKFQHKNLEELLTTRLTSIDKEAKQVEKSFADEDESHDTADYVKPPVHKEKSANSRDTSNHVDTLSPHTQIPQPSPVNLPTESTISDLPVLTESLSHMPLAPKIPEDHAQGFRGSAIGRPQRRPEHVISEEESQPINDYNSLFKFIKIQMENRKLLSELEEEKLTKALKELTTTTSIDSDRYTFKKEDFQSVESLNLALDRELKLNEKFTQKACKITGEESSYALGHEDGTKDQGFFKVVNIPGGEIDITPVTIDGKPPETPYYITDGKVHIMITMDGDKFKFDITPKEPCAANAHCSKLIARANSELIPEPREKTYLDQIEAVAPSHNLSTPATEAHATSASNPGGRDAQPSSSHSSPVPPTVNAAPRFAPPASPRTNQDLHGAALQQRQQATPAPQFAQPAALSANPIPQAPALPLANNLGAPTQPHVDEPKTPKTPRPTNTNSGLGDSISSSSSFVKVVVDAGISFFR